MNNVRQCVNDIPWLWLTPWILVLPGNRMAQIWALGLYEWTLLCALLVCGDRTPCLPFAMLFSNFLHQVFIAFWLFSNVCIWYLTLFRW